MQNFIISYKLENSVKKIDKIHLIFSNDIFENTNPIIGSYITYNNHDSIDHNIGMDRFDDVIDYLIEEFDVFKDINRLKDKHNEILMIREIMISVNFKSDKLKEKLDDVKAFIEEKMMKLNVKYGTPIKIFRRQVSRKDAFRLIEKVVNEDTLVYAIINTSN